MRRSLGQLTILHNVTVTTFKDGTTKVSKWWMTIQNGVKVDEIKRMAPAGGFLFINQLKGDAASPCWLEGTAVCDPLLRLKRAKLQLRPWRRSIVHRLDQSGASGATLGERRACEAEII